MSMLSPASNAGLLSPDATPLLATEPGIGGVSKLTAFISAVTPGTKTRDTTLTLALAVSSIASIRKGQYVAVNIAELACTILCLFFCHILDMPELLGTHVKAVIGVVCYCLYLAGVILEIAQKKTY